MIKVYLKCIAISLFWGFFQTYFYLSTNRQIVFSKIILQFSLLECEIESPYIVEITLLFIPFLVFQILFGTYIYQHFCSANIYYFSRCSNRVKWFIKESLPLYFLSLLYSFCMIISGVIVANISNSIVFDLESFFLLFYYLIIYSLWLYLTVLLINILAIKFTSSTAFIIVAGIEMTCIFLLLLFEKMLPLSNYRNVLLLKINPISHLVLAWHSSYIGTLNNRINLYSMPFDLNVSVTLFLIVSIIVTGAGCMIVKRKDLIMANNETGGI